MKVGRNGIDRRDFLRVSGASLGSVLAGGSFGLLAGCATSKPCEVAPPPPTQGRVLADLHAHPLLNSWNELSPLGMRNPILASILKQMLNKTQITWHSSYQAGIDMMCVAHFNLFDEWISMPTDPNPAAPGNTIRMMNLLEEDLQEPGNRECAVIVRNAAELKKVVDTRRTDPGFRTAVVHTVEGGHAMGGNLNALDELARRGVSMVTVTHFFHKAIGSAGNAFPFFPDAGAEYPNVGLSELGIELVRRLKRMGLIIDVTHGTVATVEDILHEVTGPLIASHASVLTLGDHSYSLCDEHIQQIARQEGLIGVILMPYWLSNYSTESLALQYGDLKDVVRTIVYVAKMAGIDKVAIGSDFSGYIPGPRGMTCLSEIGSLRRLLVREFGEDGTNKIVAENVINYFQKNWHYDPDWQSAS